MGLEFRGAGCQPAMLHLGRLATCPTVGIPSPVLGKRAMRRLIQIVFLGICAFLGGVAANLSPRLGASAAPLSVPGARLTASASDPEQARDRFGAVAMSGS